MRTPAALLVLIFATLFASAGAGCPRMLGQYPEPPRVFQGTPSLEQMMAVVNGNSSRIGSFEARNARLSGTGFPSLNASIAFDRPRRIRIRAETPFTGPEVDLGSNDDLFWFWVKRSQPPALYFCRHDQFAFSEFRRIMPIEPEWLIEAMGVTTIDPNVPHQGPFPVHGGRLEIRSTRSSSAGTFSKITIVHESNGTVLEQHLYDARANRIASAHARDHRFVKEVGASMPQQIDIEWPANQVRLRIDYGDFQLNTLHNVPSPLWQKPEYGVANVDLARPNGFAGPLAEPQSAPPSGVIPVSAKLPPVRDAIAEPQIPRAVLGPASE